MVGRRGKGKTNGCPEGRKSLSCVSSSGDSYRSQILKQQRGRERYETDAKRGNEHTKHVLDFLPPLHTPQEHATRPPEEYHTYREREKQ